MLTDQLREIGFSPADATIYELLLAYGDHGVSSISRHTKLNRTTIYESLSRLENKGVVCKISRNNVTIFQALPIHRITKHIDELQDKLNKVKQKIKNSNLDSLPRPKVFEVSELTGIEGIKAIYDELIESSEDFFTFGSSEKGISTLGGYFTKWSTQRRIKKIKEYCLFPRNHKRIASPDRWTKIRWTDYKSDGNTITIVKGEQCYHIQFFPHPKAIKIVSKEIANSHKYYFQSLWQKGKQY